MRHRWYERIWLFGIIVSIAGCSIGVQEARSPFQAEEPAIRRLAEMVSAEMTQSKIDSVAVVDFMDSDGNVTAFEQSVTNKMALSLSEFAKGAWIVSGPYLRNLFRAQEPDSIFWDTIGVEAVIYGMIEAEAVEEKANNLNICLKIIAAETGEIISEFTEKCTTPSEQLKSAPQAPEGRARQLEYEIPVFPWPPPEASASAKIPSKLLIAPGTQANLYDVARILEEALNQTGYAERSYYAVPEGFALVTRLEQINPDGTSKKSPERWAVEALPPRVFSLRVYLKSLFTAQEGHFRIIAFIVTSSPFNLSTNSIVTRDEAMKWLATGVQILPDFIGYRLYSDHHYCIALIYEFEQPTRDHPPQFKKMSALPGIDHLKQAEIWSTLGE